MMAQPKDILQREYTKFVESPTRPGNSAVEVLGNLSLTPPAFGLPTNATCYTYSVTTDGPYFVEQYKFYSGGTPASPTGLLKTISLYYSDSALENEVGGVVT
jgi:hypothetical protein